MKILFVHNFYQQHGGEERVLEIDIAILKSKGHQVDLFSLDSKNISSIRKKIFTAVNLSYSKNSKESLFLKLKEKKFDLVHVHNFFPMLTPSVYDACMEADTPVVQTFHNYRTICANALFLRNNAPCTLCLNGSPYQSVLHGCYRNSRLASFPMAHFIQKHRHEDTWNKKIDKILVPTEFSRQLFIKSGIEEKKISVRIHSLFSDPGFVSNEYRKNNGLFVGRLSKEKGILTLLDALERRQFSDSIHVIGGGELSSAVKNKKNILPSGHLPVEDVFSAMKNASFLVFPTECFEGSFPLVLMEAMACGLPIIASKIGAIPSFLEDGQDALLFEAGNSHFLALQIEKIAKSASLRMQLAKNARKKFELLFSKEASYEQLIETYQSVLKRR
jgi:glycosyltransferase involved in cell wall biosynthesis